MADANLAILSGLSLYRRPLPKLDPDHHNDVDDPRPNLSRITGIILRSPFTRLNTLLRRVDNLHHLHIYVERDQPSGA